MTVSACGNPSPHRRRSDPALLTLDLLSGILADWCGVLDLGIHHRAKEHHQT
jgi:hypothetical protein